MIYFGLVNLTNIFGYASYFNSIISGSVKTCSIIKKKKLIIFSPLTSQPLINLIYQVKFDNNLFVIIKQRFNFGTSTMCYHKITITNHLKFEVSVNVRLISVPSCYLKLSFVTSGKSHSKQLFYIKTVCGKGTTEWNTDHMKFTFRE